MPRRLAFWCLWIALFSLADPCFALRPLPCRSTGCDEALAEELESRITVQPLLAPISGGSDAQLSHASYQSTLRVMATTYQKTLEPFYLEAVQRYLAEYAQVYPEPGLWWQQVLMPLVTADAHQGTLAERQAQAWMLRKQVERLTTEGCG